MKIGDKVTYRHQCSDEEGIIKSFSELDLVTAFVVFKCAGNWDKYKDYTGQSVRISHLKLGWKSDQVKLAAAQAEKEKSCDHYFIRDNSKWSGINAATCQFCGKQLN